MKRKRGRTAPITWRRRLFRFAAAGILLILVALAAMHEHVLRSGREHLYTQDHVPRREAILVLGARVDPGGRVSAMLEDRLRTSLELFQDGKARRILVSGDGRTSDYDEVEAMSRWLIDHGVPASALLEDRAGLRTLDTVVRARRVFGLEGVIVVSNPFHVPRAVFLARHHGLDAIGVGAHPGVRYSWGTLVRNRGREIVARLVAWADVYVLETSPEISAAPDDAGGGMSIPATP